MGDPPRAGAARHERGDQADPAEGRREFTAHDYYERILINPFEPASYDVNGMFEEIAGQTFIGTCQMPQQPSQRIQLAIGRIRDRFSNITATMTLLEGRRKRRKYTGLVAHDQLILTPEKQPTDSMFEVATPWHGNRPRRIALLIDGKSLAGQSNFTGEQFDLVPKPSHRPQPPEATSLLPIAGDGEASWQLQSHNGTPITTDEHWTFKQTSPGRGTFGWLQGSQTTLSGRYSNGPAELLTLTIKQGNDWKTFRCLAYLDAGELQICIPEPGQARPVALKPAYGQLYRLRRSATQ